MAQLEAIRRKIATAGELQSVVKVMKGLAAASIRQFERAVESLADYARAIELGFAVVLRDRPDLIAPHVDGRDTPGPVGLVVFGSDQGMCGRFNQLITEHALDAVAATGAACRTVAVGARIIGLLEAEDLAVDREITPASTLAGITPMVGELLTTLLSWREERGLARIVLCYNEARGGASYAPHSVQILPVDLDWLRELRDRPWPTNRLPLVTVARADLFGALVREHVYISLFRASAESLAAENASRLASMQAAERNIDERLEELGARYRHSRQETITDELLDIVSGAEALSAATPPEEGPEH
jgi:F-type H+-transporting ATPase subunit gamma